MVTEFSGSLDGTSLKVGIVSSEFNSLVVDRLVEGARGALLRLGVAEADLIQIRVPGAWELPLACKRAIATGSVDALVATGVVIRGGTPHFDYICRATTDGLAQLSLEGDGFPIAFAVLTTDTLEQALDRAGGKAGNKGAEAAYSAIHMARLCESLK